MKNILIISLMILCTFTGCSYNKNINSNSISNSDNENISSDSIMNSDNENKGSDSISNSDNKVESDTNIQTETNLVYQNTKHGYQIVFPESWRGYYIISELDDGIISVNFYGKSKTGSISLKSNGINGLPMFFIANESQIRSDEMIDSKTKLGTVKGLDYYFFTGTSSSVGSLFDIAKVDSAVRQTAPYDVDEKELLLAKNDWDKVSNMFNELDGILKTFGPIK